MGAWTKAMARAAAYAITLAWAGGLVACGGGTDQASPAAAAAKTTPSALVHVRLPVGDWTGKDGQLVVRNHGDWESTWQANNGIWPPQPAPPLTEIDFKQHMLIGVTSSHGGCSGSIAILSAEQKTTLEGETWLVSYQVDVRENAPSAVCTMDVKPLADFVLLPASPAAVRFIELPRLR